ncbi:MAG: M6 family metalloprotease domain-containing protein [Candidatus Krumholzibacteriia bacterium]
MRLLLWLAFIAVAIGSPALAIVSPRNGGSLPAAYLGVGDRARPVRGLSGAWIDKVRAIRSSREAYVRSHGEPTALPSTYQVAGNFDVPVLLARFANQTTPYPFTDLQTRLFDGAAGTITAYFDEVSYGVLNVGGTVHDWLTVSRSEAYYEGTSNGLSPGDARTGELIKELLDANDAFVDFRAFDNDGPDGLPDSGDDDGFVDMVVIVHSDSGGECGGAEIWSHTGDYRLWPISGGQPYATDDPGANGGFIRIKDYSIQPARSCGGGVIEIGGFCHAIGHAFGLPDLFDPDGGTNGIGDWGLMGRGNWNTPDSPAHPSAWTRAQLGWVVPVDVGPGGSIQAIPQAESNPVAFKLAFSDDRFRRMKDCAIAGQYSLRCGLDTAEGATRGWSGGNGYGNAWTEAVEREFRFDGNGGVVFSYAYQYDLEANYDSVFVSIDVGGQETVLVAYNGVAGGTETIDLGPFLTTPAAYTLRFRVVTDTFGSDEDGRYLSACGAIVVDDVSVTGGGESYATDFESSVDGWFQDPARNPPAEYWLVENRQAVGFDVHLANSGLLIWHVDDEVMGSLLGNTGGSADANVRGLVLEEADGVGHLLQDPGNTGDDGDPFPGSSGNTRFDAASTPASASNTGNPTEVEVSAIGPSGPTVSALIKAGDPAPTALGVSPAVLSNDLDTVAVDITGADFRHGATFGLIMSGEADIVPIDVRWQDAGRLQGKIKVFSRKGGTWHLVVTNPDGQQSVAADALTIVQIVAARLLYASISAQGAGIELRFGLFGRERDETLVVLRAAAAAGPWRRLPGQPREIRDGSYRYVDTAVAAGHTYHYRLQVHSADGTARELYGGSGTAAPRSVVLEQNYPNPFNPVTTLAYALPEAIHVRLDIFDTSGALVRTVVNGFETAGPHAHVWDGMDGRHNPVASGVYVYRLRAGAATLSRKMLLLK